MAKIVESSPELQQLLQCANGIVWDGDLLSKSAQEYLRRNDLVAWESGFSVITFKGIKYLRELNLIRP